MIISDYNMPTINGEQLLTLVKAENEIREIPVVIYSTSISPNLSEILLELGAYSTIKKAHTYRDFQKQVSDMKQMALLQQAGPLTVAQVCTLKPLHLTKEENDDRRSRLLALARVNPGPVGLCACPEEVFTESTIRVAECRPTVYSIYSKSIG